MVCWKFRQGMSAAEQQGAAASPCLLGQGWWVGSELGGEAPALFPNSSCSGLQAREAAAVHGKRSFWVLVLEQIFLFDHLCRDKVGGLEFIQTLPLLWQHKAWALWGCVVSCFSSFQEQPQLDLETRFALSNGYPSVLFTQLLLFFYSRLYHKGVNVSHCFLKSMELLQSFCIQILVLYASLCAPEGWGLAWVMFLFPQCPGHSLLDFYGLGGPLIFTDNSQPVTVSRRSLNFTGIQAGLYSMLASVPDSSRLNIWNFWVFQVILCFGWLLPYPGMFQSRPWCALVQEASLTPQWHRAAYFVYVAASLAT